MLCAYIKTRNMRNKDFPVEGFDKKKEGAAFCGSFSLYVKKRVIARRAKPDVAIPSVFGLFGHKIRHLLYL